jgi:FkbM family methyltransferase
MAPPPWLWKLLLRLTGNDRGQELLWRGMDLSLNLLGIGPGAFVVSSGEGTLLQELRQQYDRSRAPLCIFDVGANRGTFLEGVIQPLTQLGLPFAAHAFEPGKRSFEDLERAFGGRPNFTLNNCALGSLAREAELHAPSPGSSLSSFSKRRLDHFGLSFDHTEKVAVRTLDDYCAEHSIASIDLLKLDVEGHELKVMQGGLKTFKERRIRMVTFEFGGGNIDSRTYFQDYWYFIRDNRIGAIHRMTPSGHLVPVTQYKEIYEQFRPTVFVVMQSED